MASTDGRGISNRCVFEVDRDATPTPNRASLQIYNLDPEERKKILDVGPRIPVRIQAGYVGDYQIIYQGEMLRAFVRQDGYDKVLSVQAGEGNDKIRTAQISRTFAKGTPVADAIQAIAKALDVGGIVDKTFGRVNGKLSAAWTSHGDAGYELTALLKGYDCNWYLDTGRLILNSGEAIQATGIKVQTLISDPELHLVKDKATKKNVEVVRFTTILESGMFPGAGIELAGEELSGAVSLSAVKFRGDTHGSTWISECEGVFLAST